MPLAGVFAKQDKIRERGGGERGRERERERERGREIGQSGFFASERIVTV